jgi:uncharacterized protein YraI
MSKGTVFQRIGFGLLAASLALAIGSASRDARVASAQGIATPTPTSAILQLPTATPTILGGPTATPSRTPSYAPVIAQALGDINLRSGPGTNTDIVGQLKAGDTVPVIGRSIQYRWYVVAWKDAPNGQAWVYQDLVIITGDITTVPIMEAPAAPTIDPTQYSLAQTATIALQTPGGADTATALALAQPTGVFTVTPNAPGGAAVAAGALPTFTPPPTGGAQGPIVLPTPIPVNANRAGIPPAVMIIGLGASGLLFLGLGLLRRMF